MADERSRWRRATTPGVIALGIVAGAAASALTADRAGDPTCELIAAVPAVAPVDDLDALAATVRGWRAVAGGAAAREVRVAAGVVADRMAQVLDRADAPVDVAFRLAEDADLAAANGVLGAAWTACSGR